MQSTASILELLQLLNLLIPPAVGLLWRISTQLSALQAVQLEHARRLDRLDTQRRGAQ